MIDKQQQLREQGKIISLKDMPVIASAEWNVRIASHVMSTLMLHYSIDSIHVWAQYVLIKMSGKGNMLVILVELPV